MTTFPYSSYNSLFSLVKRKVFISYHHENDQYWADTFRDTYSSNYEVFYDNSLDDEVDSDDPEYIDRKIREDHIQGTSITIVLCGAETWKRRFVDWELHGTLYHEHALLGIALPAITKDFLGNYIVPKRFADNLSSGYAYWIAWPTDALSLKNSIETTVTRSSQKRLINNSMDKLKRNSP